MSLGPEGAVSAAAGPDPGLKSPHRRHTVPRRLEYNRGARPTYGRCTPHTRGSSERSRPDRRCQRRTKGLSSVPIPSISTLTRWPARTGPTPLGVPVRITSPGSSVNAADACATR